MLHCRVVHSNIPRPLIFDCLSDVESLFTFASEGDLKSEIRSRRKPPVFSGSSRARPEVPKKRYLTRPLSKSVTVHEFENPKTENGRERSVRPIIRRAANEILENASRGPSPSRTKVRAISKPFDPFSSRPSSNSRQSTLFNKCERNLPVDCHG